MAKSKKVVQVFVKEFPEPILNRIKDHLRSTGIPVPTNSAAMVYASTQFVEQVLNKQSSESTA